MNFLLCRSTYSAARLSCQVLIFVFGSPVILSQNKYEDLYEVIAKELICSAFKLLELITSAITPLQISQISFGSCSTCPGSSKI